MGAGHGQDRIRFGAVVAGDGRETVNGKDSRERGGGGRGTSDNAIGCKPPQHRKFQMMTTNKVEFPTNTKHIV